MHLLLQDLDTQANLRRSGRDVSQGIGRRGKVQARLGEIADRAGLRARTHEPRHRMVVRAAALEVLRELDRLLPAEPVEIGGHGEVSGLAILVGEQRVGGLAEQGVAKSEHVPARLDDLAAHEVGEPAIDRRERFVEEGGEPFARELLSEHARGAQDVAQIDRQPRDA
jgi:hypothetical protein